MYSVAQEFKNTWADKYPSRMLIVFARHVSIAAGIVCSSWVWQQAQHGQVILPAQIKSATLHPVHMGKCLTPAKTIWVCHWGMFWLLIEFGVFSPFSFRQGHPNNRNKMKPVRSKPSKPSKPSFFGTECRSLNLWGDEKWKKIRWWSSSVPCYFAGRWGHDGRERSGFQNKLEKLLKYCIW